MYFIFLHLYFTYFLICYLFILFSEARFWGWNMSVLKYNTTQHNTTQHNTTQHNTTQHNTTQHNTTQHNTTQHNTTQHNTTQHNTTQHNTTQHNTTQHNTIYLAKYVQSMTILRRKWYEDGIQLPLKRFARSRVSSLIRAGWSGRTSIHPTTKYSFPWKDNCLMVTKRAIPKWKCHNRFVVYLMLLGSSCPYAQLILEETEC